MDLQVPFTSGKSSGFIFGYIGLGNAFDEVPRNAFCLLGCKESREEEWLVRFAQPVFRNAQS